MRTTRAEEMKCEAMELNVLMDISDVTDRVKTAVPADAPADKAAAEHREWFQRALAAGVRMALGSDIRPLKEAALLELGLWVKDGATPRQALLAATRDAAGLCGVGAALGTIEPGKLADLIVVAADPLQDITNLRTLRLVFKEGRLVADHRAGARQVD